MQRQVQTASTSDEASEHKMSQTTQFILSRIKFLGSLDGYDIVLPEEFDQLLDKLSMKGNGRECDQQIKNEIFNSCEKQPLRGGVKVYNIACVAAARINDTKIDEQKRQKLEQIFLVTATRQSLAGESPKRSLCWYIFKFVGMIAGASWIIGKRTKMRGFSQCIDRTQHSQQNGLLDNSLHQKPVVADGNNGGLLDSKLVIGDFSKKSEIGAEIAAITGQKTCGNRAQIGETESFVGKGCKKVIELLMGMFFIQNDVTKKMQFSLVNTLLSLCVILPTGYMLLRYLKGQDMDQNSRRSSKKSKFHKPYRWL